MKEIKIIRYAVIFLSALVLMIAMCAVGTLLEQLGVSADGRMASIFISIVFALFLIMGFSIVPIMVKVFFFLFLQVLALVRPASKHNPIASWLITLSKKQMVIVYIFWGIYIIGLIFAVPAAIESGFFSGEFIQSAPVQPAPVQ